MNSTAAIARALITETIEPVRMNAALRTEIENRITHAIKLAVSEALAAHEIASTTESVQAQCAVAFASGVRYGSEKATARISQAAFALANSVSDLGNAVSRAADEVVFASDATFTNSNAGRNRAKVVIEGVLDAAK